MNQRIRELAHQADLVIKKSNGNDFRFGAMDPKLEKFAELIVRECLDQCYYRGMNHDLYAGQLKAAEYIEQHFGVEE